MDSTISKSRRIYQDPYAHLNPDGGFDAVGIPAVEMGSSGVRKKLGNPYALLNDQGEYDGAEPSSLPPSRTQQVPESAKNRSGYYRYEQIQRRALELQQMIWRKRHELWPGGEPADPVEMLDPAIALKALGFDFDLTETLGQHSDSRTTFEVAGIVDRAKKQVEISRRLPLNTRRFTAAHELGHVLLHQELRMHRDKPLDGSSTTVMERDRVELEADKFAAYYLMPEKLLRKRFGQLFLCDQFVLNEVTQFALDPSDSLRLSERCYTVRDLARILAKAEGYNGRYFCSLADQFQVSIEAMAIRLEELEMIGV